MRNLAAPPVITTDFNDHINLSQGCAIESSKMNSVFLFTYPPERFFPKAYFDSFFSLLNFGRTKTPSMLS